MSRHGLLFSNWVPSTYRESVLQYGWMHSYRGKKWFSVTFFFYLANHSNRFIIVDNRFARLKQLIRSRSFNPAKQRISFSCQSDSVLQLMWIMHLNVTPRILRIHSPFIPSWGMIGRKKVFFIPFEQRRNASNARHRFVVTKNTFTLRYVTTNGYCF